MDVPNSGKGLQHNKRLAVIYLMQHKEDRPEGLSKFFDKLEKYEESMKEVVAAGQQAEKTLNELSAKRDQLTGSITSIVDLVVDELPDDKSSEWADKAELPPMDPSIPGMPNVNQSGPVDMAGSTSKQAQHKLQESQ